jgi:hypothetical protein
MSPTLKKLAFRAALLAVAGLVLTQILPSLADQLTPDATVETATVTESALPTPTVFDSPTVTDSQSPQPKAEITYLPSDSPTAKAKVIAAPALFFRIPNSTQVDPRATSLRFNSVTLGGTSDLLVCIKSANSALTVMSNSRLLVSGQGSQELLISGNIEDVLSTFTSGPGLTIRNPSRISGAVINFGVSALSKPSVDPKLCETPQISRQMNLTALGIDLNVVKTPVDLGKR